MVVESRFQIGGGAVETLYNGYRDVASDDSWAEIGELDANESASSTGWALDTDSTETIRVGELLRCENEIVCVSAVTSQSSLTVIREAFGTTGESHSSGTAVERHQGDTRTMTGTREWDYDVGSKDTVWDLGRAISKTDLRQIGVNISYLANPTDDDSTLDFMNLHYSFSASQFARFRPLNLLAATEDTSARGAINFFNQGTTGGYGTGSSGNTSIHWFGRVRFNAADETAGMGKAGNDGIVWLVSRSSDPVARKVMATITLG